MITGVKIQLENVKLHVLMLVEHSQVSNGSKLGFALMSVRGNSIGMAITQIKEPAIYNVLLLITIVIPSITEAVKIIALFHHISSMLMILLGVAFQNVQLSTKPTTPMIPTKSVSLLAQIHTESTKP